MADRARRLRARPARSTAATVAPAAGQRRHPADAAPVAVAARQAVTAALPPPDWAAVMDVLAAGRPGHCAAGDWPPGLMLLAAADWVTRPAVDPDAEPASPSGASAAANSSGRRPTAGARPVAAAGPNRESADGRGHRRLAADWLNSPPSSRLHTRQSPSKRRVSEDSRTAPTKRLREGQARPAVRACSQIFTALPMIFQRLSAQPHPPADADRKQIWRNRGIISRLTLRDEKSATRWCRQSRMNSIAPRRCRACAPRAAQDRSASRPKDCRG